MEITTTGRRYKITPDVREYAEKRIQKLERFFDRIQEVHLVLAEEKYRQIAELAAHAGGSEFIARVESADMQQSIDRAVDRMETQIKKHSARLKDRKVRRVVAAGSIVEEADLDDVEVEEEFSPVVVRSQHFIAMPCSVEDAIKELRDRDWEFVLFSNARSGKAALVYLRHDGNFGLVEPE